ncbi:LLM class F420-dependent oxidoreductase [Microbacterium sp. SORGH_AS_0888]|uniref:LLM class F420-dependent oxidoreductase n=1 Tax=Microbacterium sp. SORGH_AS_0888 TaxID=3041791 RepID=UPI002781FA68|nr:LLM class F420-dependent oxidoreductase [Microbacterium sp. SORGH_AS_0888]MDQ1129459.1 putative F420-dependent oxidoreductase [Microbacterium sp. SORGH_AS_0888]
MTWSERLGTVGVWRSNDLVDAALGARIEDLGYGALWLGGSPGADLTRAEEVLDATGRLRVATGIVNIWNEDAAELADSFHRIEARHPGRLLLGVGSGHREATAERAKPLEAMAAFLDVLDDRGVPAEARVLSALGPRMLQLAAERSAGTHPYLTVPAQTREAREALGPDALVAPEQTIVLDEDRERVRATVRPFMRRYLGLSNYVGNMRRAGFGDADVAGEGSDALVDAIIAHGDAAALARAVRAHLEAGADHVCVQVLPLDDVDRALTALSEALALR